MQPRLKNPKLKVCLVCPKVYPVFNASVEATFGGAEVDLYYLGTELAKDSDFDVSYITADYGQPAIESRENVTLIKSLSFKQNPLTGALKIWRAMRKADANIYMIKSISPGLFLVALFCRFFRRNFFYRTAHTTHCDGTYIKRHSVTGYFFLRVLKKANFVFTQNKSDACHLMNLYQIDSITIPNAHRIRNIDTSVKQSILWVGRSAGFKHPDRFIELTKAFPNESFVMICQWATGDTRYDALKTDASGIANLTFIERVPFHDIDRYFEQAKVFVNTSDSEGFPNTFIQACKAGAAILSFNVNPDNFLDANQCGICCGGEMSILKDKLTEMLCENNYQEYGNNGLSYVKNNHDITAIIEQYKMIFKGDRP